MTENKSLGVIKFLARLALVAGMIVLGLILYKMGTKMLGDKLKEGTEIFLIAVVITIPLLLFLLINHLGIRDSRKTTLQMTWVALILTLGSLAMFVMIAMKKPPEKKPMLTAAPLLNSETVFADQMQMTIQGFGTVQPRIAVQVVPQVSGKVIRCHQQFIDGGFFKANEPLVVVEETDYKLAVESAQAAVAQAEVKLEQEKAEADVARQEWYKLHPGKEPESSLVFRGPQIKNAEAQLNAAKAQLAKAKLDLERTTITMPFDGRVVKTSIDTGQFITAGAPIATVYRTDVVEVLVPLEDSDLAWFNVKLSADGGNHPNSHNSSPATVSATFAGQEYTWPARVVRTAGEVDARSRMVPVVTEVKNPFDVDNGQPPLMPGMFVRVDIEGRTIDNVFRVPRYAIRGSGKVWLARVKPQEEDKSNDNKEATEADASGETEYAAAEAAAAPPEIQYCLRIQDVTILRMDKQFAYIAEGLQDGDIVITSPLETVTKGMTIRIMTDNDEEE